MQVFSRKTPTADGLLDRVPVRPSTTSVHETLPTVAPKRTVVPTSPEPIQTPRHNEAVITSAITIEGNVRSESSLRLEGTVAGDVQGLTVTVTEEGNVLGSIEGEDVSIYGRVTGTVRGKNIMLYRSARVEGDIIHQGIGMEMGTHYEGRLQWDNERAGNQDESQKNGGIEVGERQDGQRDIVSLEPDSTAPTV